MTLAPAPSRAATSALVLPWAATLAPVSSQAIHLAPVPVEEAAAALAPV